MKRPADKSPSQFSRKSPSVKRAADPLATASPGTASDEVLMKLTQQGDGQAFSILYERHAPAISGYLRRMLGNVEDVEGLSQEVFVRAFRFAPTYRYPSRFSTWLFTIARNLAINNARSRHRNPVRNVGEWSMDGAEPVGLSSAASSDPDEIDKQEEIARVLAALEYLPAVQKEVIVLRLFQDLTYAQIGQLMGTSPVTLRSRMFHGLRKLATLVSENENAGPAELENPCGHGSPWAEFAATGSA